MKVTKHTLKKHNNNNHFAKCWMPLDSGESTYFLHEKGIVGVCFVNDYVGNTVVLNFVKDSIEYETRLKSFKSQRSLALTISRFHKEIEKLTD